MIRLKDGEKREIRPAAWVSPWGKNIRVIAERVDSETPIIHLSLLGCVTDQPLTDADADDLINRLKKALSILPTSK